MKKDLAIRALNMAVRLRAPVPGCIFHADRGCQYCSYDFWKNCMAHGVLSSMSEKGTVLTKLLSKRFQKPEGGMALEAKLTIRRQATTAIFQYINGFYNLRRCHSYLGGEGAAPRF